MNIFVLDSDIKKCAQYHCDKHVVKMIIEYAQMLSTTVRLTTDLDIGYKITHKNHPCTVWVRKSLSNWKWLKELSKEVNEEYKYRYDKEVNHKSFDVIQSLPEPNIPDIGLTEFPLAMPEYCMVETPTESYRNYYMKEKSNFVSWKKRDTPKWYLNVG
jgi:hypothetical protein